MKANRIFFLLLLLALTVVLLACGKKNDTATTAQPTEPHEHTPGEAVVENKVDKTCTQAGGYDEVVYCLTCGEQISRTYCVLNPYHVYEKSVCVYCGAFCPSDKLTFTSANDGTCAVTDIGKCTDTFLVIPEYSPDGDLVTAIGAKAFYENETITKIYLGANVTQIDESAFCGCINLLSVIVDGQNPAYTAIDDSLYSKDGKTLVQYAIGKTDTEVSVAQSVERIGSGAFRFAKHIRSVYIPKSVVQIGEGAFGWLPSLQSITVEASNEAYLSLDGSLYTKDIKTLMQYAIGKADTAFILPQQVERIAFGAFAFCESLQNVSLSPALESIGRNAFYGCRSLLAITLPDTVCDVAYGAFAYCESLTELTFPALVDKIDEAVAFGCTNLQSVSVLGEITSIAYCAFAYCKSLTAFVVPSTVVSIGEGAFFECDLLQAVYIPISVQTIGLFAFDLCPLLTIYCQAQRMPAGWDEAWFTLPCTVVWGSTMP